MPSIISDEENFSLFFFFFFWGGAVIFIKNACMIYPSED